ncbi:hypothetical protein [Telluribacter sp.]|jgi:phosphotriesterase-related protein|uniref:phosphotriesterase family protein n=1 Tax=Telluribacter sp. TaxID=1978767 RepID=UPI002E0ED6D1|nr:hypothetical protein [Telluribacter sp.]
MQNSVQSRPTNREASSRRTFLKWLGASSAISLLPTSTPQASSGKPPTRIPTATGEIFSDQMGITSVHEHIPLPSNPAQREKSLAFAIDELKKAKTLGLQTIIDVGPTEDVVGIREVAQATGVNVVCCTGFYVLKDDQQSMTVEDFETHMRRQIEEGIQGTQIRPGVIKVATRRLPITPAEKNLFIAAARIQQRYHLPICTHAVSGCAEQQRILEAAGADLTHCYFSHIEATFGWEGRSVEQEIDYLQAVVEKGSTLSFNNFGNWNHTKPEDLALIIRELTNRGYDDRMVVTIDFTWSMENGNIKILWGDTNADGNDRTYSYPIRKVVPWLKEQGIPNRSITRFMKDNPERLFTW